MFWYAPSIEFVYPASQKQSSNNKCRLKYNETFVVTTIYMTKHKTYQNIDLPVFIYYPRQNNTAMLNWIDTWNAKTLL